MPADSSNSFQSVLAALMEKFLQEKHACGYDYHEPTRILRRLDDFLVHGKFVLTDRWRNL